MFNIGPGELLVLLVLALLIFGPNRLPELARGLGRAVKEFKKATDLTDDEGQETPGKSP